MVYHRPHTITNKLTNRLAPRFSITCCSDVSGFLRNGPMMSCAMIELHPSRYELLTDMVAASMPATTRPRTPEGKIVANMRGMASSEFCDGPSSASAAMPHIMGIMPRPRKMKPAHENTRFAVSGLRVEKVRIAVVCQSEERHVGKECRSPWS